MSVIGAAACIFILVYMIRQTVNGLRTGETKRRGTVYRRDENSMEFWSALVTYGGAAVVFTGLAASFLRDWLMAQH
jgi:hypothetical protein